jgi:hypothetical protein
MTLYTFDGSAWARHIRKLILNIQYAWLTPADRMSGKSAKKKRGTMPSAAIIAQRVAEEHDLKKRKGKPQSDSHRGASPCTLHAHYAHYAHFSKLARPPKIKL